MRALLQYWRRSPYEQRISEPSLNIYKSKRWYRTNFYLLRKLPMQAFFQFSRALGTSTMVRKAEQWKDVLSKVEDAGKSFSYFTFNQWVFDNYVGALVWQKLTPEDQETFNADVSKILWDLYIMNFAYGIKKFILKEDAELPSMGQNNAITVIPWLNPFSSTFNPNQRTSSGSTPRGKNSKYVPRTKSKNSSSLLTM